MKTVITEGADAVVRYKSGTWLLVFIRDKKGTLSRRVCECGHKLNSDHIFECAVHEDALDEAAQSVGFSHRVSLQLHLQQSVKSMIHIGTLGACTRALKQAKSQILKNCEIVPVEE